MGKVVLTGKGALLLIVDSDGLVLAVVEVFLPVFIGLEEPEEDDKAEGEE